MSIKDKGRRITQPRKWSAVEDARLADLYAHHKLADIAQIMGRNISSIANRRQKLGLTRTPEQQARIGDGKFKPGAKTWNAGKKGWQAGGRSKETQFKKGERPSNTWRPIGAERLSKDGILYRKVADTGVKKADWKAVHVLVWEEHNGPLPDGLIVVFIDRDRENFAPDNLEAVTRAENMKRNSIDRYPPEYRRSAITLGWFKRKLNKIEDQQNENAR
ncbi:HNH endonuclease signature motif containing protein [Vreelandella maris]|uniref:HNH endonuclease signature motif containing protein n=1 Tax=Vreelandella maris TaxID=2729617 RepID=UPI0030EC0C2C